ncbi:hypothetical protein [Deinococcus planocerae]|uniref:hypothetical protein n=1 Tax=Deinococcus planocerae TaxID=1737569 RepID=UPI000C7F5C04|nr:hypothetical protein [Deinococcus planocerae]
MASDAWFTWCRDYGRAAEVWTLPGLRRRAEARGFRFTDNTAQRQAFDFTLERRSRRLWGDVKRAGRRACNFPTVSLETLSNRGERSWAFRLDVLCVVKEEPTGTRVYWVNLRKYREDTADFTAFQAGEASTMPGPEGSTVLNVQLAALERRGCLEDVTAEFTAAYREDHGDTPPESLFTPSPERDAQPMPPLALPSLARP